MKPFTVDPGNMIPGIEIGIFIPVVSEVNEKSMVCAPPAPVMLRIIAYTPRITTFTLSALDGLCAAKKTIFPSCCAAAITPHEAYNA